MALKSKINILLPIVLAVFLPALSLYANTEWKALNSLGLYWSWFIASIILYLLWYILWYAWTVTAGYQKWWSVLLPGVLIAGLLGFFYLLVFRNIEEFSGYNISRFLLPSVLFFVIQYALRTQQNYAKLLLEKEQMQTENYKAQLKTLRAQIDPHFLFNSLNTLRSMVRQQHANAEQFVMSLADFYRKTLQHNEQTTLTLSEELIVLQSYLFLMKSRNEDAVQIHIEIPDKFQAFRLPTLALQTVLENCFKHNSMTAKKPLKIDIRTTDDHYVQISNNLQPKIGTSDSTGFGLDLLRKRYALMDIKNGVIIEEKADQFKVKIKLTE